MRSVADHVAPRTALVVHTVDIEAGPGEEEGVVLVQLVAAFDVADGAAARLVPHNACGGPIQTDVALHCAAAQLGPVHVLFDGGK